MKKKVLIFIDWFTPGFKAGGPIKSVSNIVNSLSNDFDFYIVTSDRDLNDTTSYKNIKFNEWIKESKYSIIYLTSEKRDSWIKLHLQNTKYDFYYLNSLFSKNYTIKPFIILNKLFKKKIIIAPRGMLGKASLAIKPFKKSFFIQIAKSFNYYKDITWHATSKDEEQNILNQFGSNARVKIASNISNSIIEKKIIIKEKNKLSLVFFSRISPIKNLLYVLSLLKDIDNVTLDIFGTIEDQTYWNECSSLIKLDGLTVKFRGELIPKNVITTLSKYHFLILPTSHENYGHVIVEALTAGCGLIISNNTPWRNLEDKNIGWDIDLENKERFLTVLKKCLLMNQNEYNSIRNNCYSFVEHKINTNKEIEDTKKLFTN